MFAMTVPVNPLRATCARDEVARIAVGVKTSKIRIQTEFFATEISDSTDTANCHRGKLRFISDSKLSRDLH